ncbi:hypothetical protein IMCC9480_2447 [Oxalobacteraceae bacterium IMCC9480]|nr:hypothetical protein IMCC9480_2447 [Oxalobacteraceae bacterium IMCC9480]
MKSKILGMPWRTWYKSRHHADKPASVQVEKQHARMNQ